MSRALYLQDKQRGVSLVEALVALAVMAFGMLGLAGVQSTLRLNADVSKQRSEAVRIAQAAVEDWRAYALLAATPDVVDYADIVTAGPTAEAGINATYQVTRTVTDSAAPASRSKTVVVDVTWTDRANQPQGVRLPSSIAGIAPELAGSLTVPAAGDPTRQPRGRSTGIPAAAIDQGDGTSRFVPPGSTATAWTFNNATGVIASICTLSDPPADTSSCIATNARLLSGFVRFALQMIEPTTELPTPIPVQPTPEQSEVPPSAALAVQVTVEMTLPIPAATVECFEALSSNRVAYYCAVPVTTDAQRWSGRSLLGGLPLATGRPDASATSYRICRYTPVRGCQPTVGSTIWGERGSTASCTGASPSPGRLMGNADHPRDYASVEASLTNHNFLVIRSGDGTTAFNCPEDDRSTPFVNGSTSHHQPDP